MPSDKPVFKTVGEFQVDGIYFCDTYNKDSIEKIKNSFIFMDDDTLLATYTKSGIYFILSW